MKRQSQFLLGLAITAGEWVKIRTVFHTVSFPEVQAVDRAYIEGAREAETPGMPKIPKEISAFVKVFGVDRVRWLILRDMV